MKYRTLIVDDEPAARRMIESMLSEHAELIEVIGEAVNGYEAVEMIDRLRPDLVFLDIQMPGLTGLEVLREINFRPNIIFTTAYEQYALQAFETFSVDYLLKPIRQERLDDSLKKLQQFGKKKTAQPHDWTGFIHSIEQKKPIAFPVRTGDKIMLVRFENISHFQAADKYVALLTVDGKKYLSDESLSSLAEKLPQQFIRIQKSYIINKDLIKEIQKHFNGRFVITMADRNLTRLTSGLTFYDSIRMELGL